MSKQQLIKEIAKAEFRTYNCGLHMERYIISVYKKYLGDPSEDFMEDRLERLSEQQLTELRDTMVQAYDLWFTGKLPPLKTLLEEGSPFKTTIV